jgi:AcrR family transcriptional regulator
VSALAEADAAGGRRERTKAQNRGSILAAARDVFAQLGYEGATVRDISRRTELASGTFYNYFPDKEAVLRALVEEDAAGLRARLREVRAAATAPEAFVGDAYRVYFSWIAADRAAFELVSRNSASIRQLIDEPALGGGVDELIDELLAASARGDLPPVDAEYMAAAMAGVALEVAVRMVERDPPDVEGAARFATDLFLGGIERLGSGAEAAPDDTRVAN